MVKRILKFAESRQFVGCLARSGENGTRTLAFDCSAALAEYPNAQIIAVIQRPQGEPYTVTPDTDGTIRRITLTSYDLEYNGHLQVELRVLDGEKILKSAIYTATVDDSIRGEADAPGQPVRDVLDRLDAEIKQAQAVVDDIRQKLENGEFNGSDAAVTAANIEAALGYMPVAPSSAELLHSITVSESGVKQVNIPAFPDLSRIIVGVVIPIVAAQFPLFMLVQIDGNKSYTAGSYYGLTEAESSIRYEIKIDAGIVYAESSGTGRGWGGASIIGANNAGEFITGEAITGAYFYTPGDTDIPEGTTFNVYGVKI